MQKGATQYTGSIAEGFRVELPSENSGRTAFSSRYLLHELATNVEAYGNGWKPSPAVLVEKAGDAYRVRYFTYSTSGRIDMMFPMEQQMCASALKYLIHELEINGIPVQLPDGYRMTGQANAKRLEIRRGLKRVDGSYEVDTSNPVYLGDQWLGRWVHLARRVRRRDTADGNSPSVWLEPGDSDFIRFIAIGVDKSGEPYLFMAKGGKSQVLSARDALLRRGIKTATWVREYK